MAGTEGFHVDSPEQIAAKQAKLHGDAPEPESGLSAGYDPPPKVVPKYVMGEYGPNGRAKFGDVEINVGELRPPHQKRRVGNAPRSKVPNILTAIGLRFFALHACTRGQRCTLDQREVLLAAHSI